MQDLYVQNLRRFQHLEKLLPDLFSMVEALHLPVVQLHLLLASPVLFYLPLLLQLSRVFQRFLVSQLVLRVVLHQQHLLQRQQLAQV